MVLLEVVRQPEWTRYVVHGRNYCYRYGHYALESAWEMHVYHRLYYLTLYWIICQLDPSHHGRSQCRPSTIRKFDWALAGFNFGVYCAQVDDGPYNEFKQRSIKNIFTVRNTRFSCQCGGFHFAGCCNLPIPLL